MILVMTQEDPAFVRGHILVYIVEWSRAIDMQMRRVVTSKSFEDREVDSKLFAIALRNLLRAVEWGIKEADRARDGERSKGLRAALNEFNAAIPHAVQVRDLLDHFDGFVLGKSPHEPQSSNRWYSWNGTTAGIHIGGYELDVVAATKAVSRLATKAGSLLSE
jgi:hypothetical protein